jgi:RHH-type proline utilization regulon transcriptional repressor/proline dehydrogenase/delta 1-pyrroline-5-carboxylate dehydrogenase
VACRCRRVQNREVEYPVLDLGAEFCNDAVTDWTREENRDWVARALDEERKAGVCEILGGGDGAGEDPGEPGKVICRHPVAGPRDVEEALGRADGAWRAWGAEVSERRRLLKEAGCEIGRQRGRLVAVLVADAGEAVEVADAEVCEAVDLANYYADSLWWPGLGDGVSAEPLGVVVVRPSADAPLATACGGVLSALMAGNAVVLVPAPEAVLTAWRLTEILRESGVPKDLLQFLPAENGEVVQGLVTDARVKAIAEEGRLVLMPRGEGPNPEGRGAARLGPNTVLISAAADRHQAVRDLVRSAFGQAGRSRAAVSVAIVEGEVCEDGWFLERLRDAAASLPVGTGWDLASVVTPLAGGPGCEAKRALSELDAGEAWLLKPEHFGGHLWSPGIRTGVRKESRFVGSPCRGPVLGLVRVEDFEEGLRVQNAIGGGLSGGLQSLDEREVAIWREKVRVGMAHVNRPVERMIVRRQPFGGWGQPAMAGGPNHVPRLVKWREESLPTAWGDRPGWMDGAVRKLRAVVETGGARIAAAAGSFAQWWADEFGVEHDPSGVLGESHVFRYRPVRMVVCRVDGMAAVDVALVCLAARCCGVELELSGSDESLRPVAEAAEVSLTVESEKGLGGRLAADVLRVLEARESLCRAATKAGARLEQGAVLANGRLELLRYLGEQTVSEVTHRHGTFR